MNDRPPNSHGLIESLRKLGDGLLGSIQDRVELFSLEIHEEKFRAIQIFIWISAAVFTALMGMVFASITLVYLFWESARLTVFASLAVFYFAVFAVVVILFRRYLGRQPRPFSATLQELGEDRTCIRAEN